MKAIGKIKKKITSIPVKKYCAKGYRKISHRKGYGVHSPFVYCLITKTIEEKAAYYKYSDIEALHRKTKAVLNSMGKYPVKLQKLKTSKLLFRLANRFKPCSVLECGTSYGVSAYSLCGGSSGAAVTTVEPDTVIGGIATANTPGADILNVPYKEGLVQFFGRCECLDFIYIRSHTSAEDYRDIFSAIGPHIPENVVIVAEGIRNSKEVYEFFCGFTAHDRIKIVMDLYDIGILIASPKLNKERYKEAF